VTGHSIAATTPLAFGLQPGTRDSSTPQKRKARILVVDDDPGLLRLLTIRLRAENYEVEAVESAAAALAACTRFRPDLVITDLRMDQMDGIGLLKELQSRWPGLRVIILTAHGTIPDAVHATQSGLFGFLTKPVDKQDLLEHVQKALKVSGFAHVDEDWRANIVTRNQLMEDKLAQANMVAGTDARVLLTGESGTGKELLARAIHDASPRRNKPFVAINCSAMAENILESELFGHEKDAFNGATRSQKGLFETAEGGTLLLDEVGDMPMRLQVKLLRVLQENHIRPVGGEEAVEINVRVISATHRDLHQLMISGQFREDLYYRLNVVHIEMPSLGRRREDIPLLAAHFLEHMAKETVHSKIYAPNDHSELLFGPFRIDGDCQRFRGSPFRLGEGSWRVAQVLEALLAVERDRVIDFGPDTLLAEKLPERVPLMNPNDVLIEDMTLVRHGPRSDDAAREPRRGKFAIVICCLSFPPRRPTVQVFQLDAQDRRLQLIDAKISADQRMKIFRLAAVNAEHAHPFGKFRVPGGAQPGIAESSQILARKKGKAA